VTTCFFAADIHGREDRWAKLFRRVEEDPPRAVFLGGDLLPFGDAGDTLDFLTRTCDGLRRRLGSRYPQLFVILGNDDRRIEEPGFVEASERGLWTYAHERWTDLGPYLVYGYSYVPPTPFGLKDWERYDVSRFVDPGCVSPEEGFRTVAVPETEVRHATIARDLDLLVGKDLDRAILLFHTPPYRTKLDRAALDGRSVDHVPLDVHVGSIALRRFIEAHEPRITLHGHIHESARLTGSWRDRIGRCHLFGAAHDGPELALVRFDADDPAGAVRELL
jgi:Icc-related predicted phosphoesterase